MSFEQNFTRILLFHFLCFFFVTTLSTIERTNEREKKLKQWIETWSVSFVYVRMIMSFAIEYNKKKKMNYVSFLSFFFFISIPLINCFYWHQDIDRLWCLVFNFIWSIRKERRKKIKNKLTQNDADVISLSISLQ